MSQRKVKHKILIDNEFTHIAKATCNGCLWTNRARAAQTRASLALLRTPSQDDLEHQRLPIANQLEFNPLADARLR